MYLLLNKLNRNIITLFKRYNLIVLLLLFNFVVTGLIYNFFYLALSVDQSKYFKLGPVSSLLIILLYYCYKHTDDLYASSILIAFIFALFGDYFLLFSESLVYFSLGILMFSYFQFFTCRALFNERFFLYSPSLDCVGDELNSIVVLLQLNGLASFLIITILSPIFSDMIFSLQIVFYAFILVLTVATAGVRYITPKYKYESLMVKKCALIGTFIFLISDTLIFIDLLLPFSLNFITINLYWTAMLLITFSALNDQRILYSKRFKTI